VLHHGHWMAADGPETSAVEEGWRPPICKTVAVRGEGVADLMAAIQAHREHLQSTATQSLRERARAEDELLDILGQQLMGRLMARVQPQELGQLVAQIVARELDPYTAVEQLLNRHSG